MESEPIEALTRAAAGGDRLALERLLERHLPELRAYVERRAGVLLRRHESGSDLVQSVCREILEHSEAFQHTGEGAFRRWLFTTALRKMASRRRFVTADRRDLRRRDGQPRADTDDEAADARFTTDRTPSQDAAIHEEMARIEAAMQALSSEYSQVIRLSRVEGLPRAEVAERMNRSEASVRMLLHRALTALAIEMRARE
ncbi:ECF RNA polymerase sigma factor SigD [Planctomycetes bacterium Poly30]|uniref:ECF RNA polymerase sigma factor SigD n=1 Tax=Saltatorellus ferox TaxID=2528018 RepID=A0A518EV46_9BACT|nr:ECF RNA polymerase sigma factor SigD [Planctomycetes bacterium Poly30]